MMNKEEASKYILLQLCNWYYELNPSKMESRENDLSILKALKLIFFLSTINKENKTLLDNPFNDFLAMPLGPVESDVYNFFKKNDDIINYKRTQHENIIYDLCQDEMNKIDFLLEELKQLNYDLVNKSAFYLVDLTHEWDCWKNSFKTAEEDGRNSQTITRDEILASKKYYSY